MEEYKFLRVIDECVGDLLALDHPHWGRQVWVYCKVRRAHTCVVCRGAIARGEEAYRPMTDRGNRMERVCFACARVWVKRQMEGAD